MMFPDTNECNECAHLSIPNPKCCEKVLREPKKNLDSYRICCNKYKTNKDCKCK